VGLFQGQKPGRHEAEGLVAPSRNGSTIRDFNGNALPNGPATGGEYTFGFKAT